MKEVLQSVEDRMNEIYSKGFDMFRSLDQYAVTPQNPLNYRSIKVGVKTLEDATLDLNSLKKRKNKVYTKEDILIALADRNLDKLREISDHFFRTNGIYRRVCSQFATMYRYDWYIVPELYTTVDKVNETKVTQDFYDTLKYLDDSYIKKVCGEIALNVIKYGCYYGYICEASEGFVIQELPIKYCRVRYNHGPIPAVEFNLKYFDDTFSDPIYRLRILKMFPKEFETGYKLWKEGKLTQDPGDYSSGAWYLLSKGSVCKFDFGPGNGDAPLFADAIPELMDLDDAQDLDRRKQLQKLLKILVQKLPRDKNGDLIFDVDEARDIHNNAVQMLKNAVGVDVLTTFADIQAIDVSDENTSASNDDLERVERSAYNAFGVPNSIFNSDGNIALSNSILNDEAYVRTMVLQFGTFWDRMVRERFKRLNKKKKWNFRLYMLETTQYNYQQLSKLYKEQTQIGFSKVLPQIALGHSQSSILRTITFENDILNLPAIMIPPLMSSTMNIETIKEVGSKGTKLSSGESSGEVGRPEKDDSEKSDKTLANIESMS